MGLPDLGPLQNAMLEKIQAKMDETTEQMNDPEFYFKTFLPVGVQTMDQFQKFFAEMAASAAGAGKLKKDR